MRDIRINKALSLLALISLGGCQSALLSDSRIASNTAGIIGESPSNISISNRSSDPTNTYYTAKTSRGATYACVINGGGVLAAGMTNPPACHPVTN